MKVRNLQEFALVERLVPAGGRRILMERIFELLVGIQRLDFVQFHLYLRKEIFVVARWVTVDELVDLRLYFIEDVRRNLRLLLLKLIVQGFLFRC